MDKQPEAIYELAPRCLWAEDVHVETIKPDHALVLCLIVALGAYDTGKSAWCGARISLLHQRLKGRLGFVSFWPLSEPDIDYSV
jgi:hypothetical protein